MTTEDYVSFETAKLLKEKGFKQWCYKCYGTAVYHKGEPISFDEEHDLLNAGLGDEIEYVEGGYLYDFGCDNREEHAKVWAAPTLWAATKWLVREYKLYVHVVPSVEGYYWTEKWHSYVEELDKRYPFGKFIGTFNSPEQAYDAAIKYCLENLI